MIDITISPVQAPTGPIFPWSPITKRDDEDRSLIYPDFDKFIDYEGTIGNTDEGTFLLHSSGIQMASVSHKDSKIQY